jgi:arsenite methyltransferase
VRNLLVRVFLFLLGSIGALLFFGLVIIKLGYRVRAMFGKPAPCPVAPFAWKWTLEAPMRIATVPSMLDWMGIKAEERVLEVGTGPGVYTIPLAQRIGPAGQLVSVDIQAAFIEEVKRRVQRAELCNVTTYVADAQLLPLADASVDRVVLADILPEVPDQRQALSEASRVLTPNGLLNITGEFPDPDYFFAQEMISLIEGSGYFRLEQQKGNWWRYVLSFKKV